MKRILFGFLIGVLAGVAGVWQVEQRMDGRSLVQTHRNVAEEAAAIRASVQDTLENLTPEAIRRDLAQTSIVVRDKAGELGRAFMDATANARTTATIKTKLFSEADLPAMQIHVDTANGLVTLSGTLPNHEQVARAVKLALETEGVSKVVSTIQVAPPPASPAP